MSGTTTSSQRTSKRRLLHIGHSHCYYRLHNTQDREGEMLHVMHEKRPLAAVFMQFLLARTMRSQSDLVEQLFNSSEKHLAKILLLMADFGAGNESEKLIAEISEKTLAENIGTTQSKVSYFINCFRALGLIDYGRIRVRKALLDAILQDQFPDDNAVNRLLSTYRGNNQTLAHLPLQVTDSLTRKRRRSLMVATCPPHQTVMSACHTENLLS
jgi:hypothetical protein